VSSIQHIPSVPSNPEQQQIDLKIKEVKLLQEEITQLNIAIPEAIKTYQTIVNPIAEKIKLLQKEKLIALDIYVHEIKFSKRELSIIDTYMAEQIAQWIYEHGSNEELADLFITYAHTTFDEYILNLGTKSVYYNFEESEIGTGESTDRSNTKKKTAAQRKGEKAKLEQEQHRRKSIRAIYIDLIKAFHPDTEQDATKKLEKEEISKKITEAYGKNDLYTLLDLETQFLEQESNRLSGMKPETAKSYLAMLDSQIKELKESIRSILHSHDKIFIEMCKPNSKPEKFLRKVKKELQEGVQILTQQVMILQHVDPSIKSDLLFEMERQNNQR
jgi:hypothetical protein